MLQYFKFINVKTVKDIHDTLKLQVKQQYDKEYFMKDLFISIIFIFIVLLFSFCANRIYKKLEDIEIAIIESNMTYEEYCEYYPEECEELF